VIDKITNLLEKLQESSKVLIQALISWIAHRIGKEEPPESETSIPIALSTFNHQFQFFTDFMSTFFAEQLLILSKNQEAKPLNEAIEKSMMQIKGVFNRISEFVQENNHKENQREAALEFMGIIKKEIVTMKVEVGNLAKHLKRKCQLIKEDKLNFSKVETKSNNLKILGEHLVAAIGSLLEATDSLCRVLDKCSLTFISEGTFQITPGSQQF